MTVIGMINSYNKLIIIYCLLIYTDQLNSWVIFFKLGASIFEIYYVTHGAFGFEIFWCG